MQIMRCLFLLLLCGSFAVSCNDGNNRKIVAEDLYPTSKPCTRWWWFATEIKKDDIKYQLDWAKEHNFGGVEIAWVYPLHRYKSLYKRLYNRQYPTDTTAQKWLSDEWVDVVHYTKLYADSIGLSCDYTFGSAWPVASSNIPDSLGTQIYGDSTFQQLLTFAWTWPDTQLVINHLDSNAFARFAEPIAKALQKPLEGSKSALFTDSWEIKLNDTNKIWTKDFDKSFYEKFGYDILPYMEAGLDSFPDVRYDYMLHLDEYVTQGFYKPYVDKCKEMGAWSRVQCLASPTDVMTTYGLVDIPETEAMLNNPNYSRIVSSSACLASKPIVSSESFTCMYGFPGTYLREEQTADLKLVADALFAEGVNHHVYHGMPYNPEGSDSIDFFATTYFGPGGSLTSELKDFNAYIESVSGIMRQGKSYTDVAVYVPYEDGVMKGAYPPERRRVWVWGEYELRYIFPPKELEGYHPLWINRHFLENAEYKDAQLHIGDATFSSLYIDVDYMDLRALKRIYELAQEGLPVCLKSTPSQPGKSKAEDFQSIVENLRALENVSDRFDEVHPTKPLVTGSQLPNYWCKVYEDGSHIIFLAQLAAKELKYPLYSGQAYSDETEVIKLEFNVNGHNIIADIEFKPYQSIALKIDSKGGIEYLDIEYRPNGPVVKPKEEQRMYF